MQSVFAAMGTEFFKLKFFLVLFFILLDTVIHVFASGANELDVLFTDSGHCYSL